VYVNLFTLQNTPAPRLEATVRDQQLFLSWTVPSLPFVLQQASDLSAPQWTHLTNLPALIYTNLHYQVSVPTLKSNAFHRLSGTIDQR
jgi:hypothetical protein